MSLLNEIQNAAVDPDSKVSFILRKCKILGAKLGNEEFNKWIDQELNGYNDKESLPDYRVFPVQSKGHFAGPFGSGIKNAEIPPSCIDKKFHKVISKSHCIQPISYYEDLLAGSSEGAYEEPWSTDLTAYVGQEIYESMNCLAAWKVIPRGKIITLVDAVRNRILSFALEIESEDPDAGEAPLNNPPIPQERVSQVFHTHIYGNVGNIAEGSTNIKQSARVDVVQNDLESLTSFLYSIGFPKENIEELKAAIQSDPIDEVKESKRLGSKVSTWLGSALSAIAQGLLPIVQNVDANLITNAILSYYGLN